MPVTSAENGGPDGWRPLLRVSPSALLSYLDCPRRYRMAYLDVPRPPKRAQRAHTSLGIAVHNALRDWWDLPVAERTPHAGAALVRRGWIRLGFRDDDQSAHHRERSAVHVGEYLATLDPAQEPRGIERTVAMVTGALAVTGRVDRLDEREGELVVVDYKTGRTPLTDDDARFSLPLALYAGSVWKMFRRPCLKVELHHLPTGVIARHEHTPESLTRKVEEARSIGADIDIARERLASGDEDPFPPRVGPICRWCDLRAHCPEGQAYGPEEPDWAGLPDT
ncbi:RecB family exonuclease [Janibacter sp. GXQ6167]|uniref:RecB family exonuclease n=1 Tax=Janibacter sp. GXQ6167 TaxID=3240791 RepID=UPI0035262D2E